MSFLPKKKRCLKFLVNLEIEELSAVPSINGLLFAKVRLIEGGTFTVATNREPIINNAVVWQKKCEFTVRMSTSPQGVLEQCKCRVSVRKELGKSVQKVGYVDLDLAPFTRSGKHVDRRILSGYSSRSPQDNSVLKVNASLTLLTGDPYYKSPDLRSNVFSAMEIDDSCVQSTRSDGIHVDCPAYSATSAGAAPIAGHAPFSSSSPSPGLPPGNQDDGSLASSSSGFGSLPRPRDLTATPPAPPTYNRINSSPSNAQGQNPQMKLLTIEETNKHHKRENSGCSTYSKYSDSSSIGRDAMCAAVNGTHSRQSSQGAGYISQASRDSIDGPISDFQKARQLTRLDSTTCIENRVDCTRPNADLLVDNFLRNADNVPDVNNGLDTPGLQLFVSQRDGRTVLGSKHSVNKMAGGSRGYSQVIIENKD